MVRAATQPAKPTGETPTGEHHVTTGMTVDSSAPPQNASVRTIILGIDHSGRIVQHDRQAPAVLGRPAEKLLGASLSDLVSDPSPAEDGESNGVVPAPANAGDNVVQSLLEALKADREGTGMLSIHTESGDNLDAIVTVHPMRAGDANVAALALLRIPSPVAARFVDPALMRQTLLDGTFKRIGDSLDFDHVARELMSSLVPHFCNSGGVAVLESLIGDDEFPSHGPDGTQPLRRLAVANDAEDPAWEATFPIGEILRYPRGSSYVQCMDSGKPVMENRIPAADAAKLADLWQRPPVAELLADASMLLLPLIAQGSTLGFLVCVRKPGYRSFDAYDQEIGMEFASRRRCSSTTRAATTASTPPR